MRILIALLVLCVALVGGAVLLFASPSREALAARAAAEREVLIYGNADATSVAPLIEAFKRKHPSIAVRYEDIASPALTDRFVDETARGVPSADLVWSSAMDLQAKLVNDGYALQYASPEKSALPASAVWNDMGYGVTAEPIGIVYNRNLIAPADVPRTHQALEALLRARREELTGKVVFYDPTKPNVGYFFLTQDLAMTRDTRSLLRAIAATRPQLAATTAPMVEAVAEGRAAIAYNVVGPYALEWAEKDPRVGVVFPEDYTLVASRVAFIARDARHPAAAKLFLDFMLSREGQSLLAESWLPPMRTDRPAPWAQNVHARPIRGGPQLFVNLDPVKRRQIIAEWDAILAEGNRPQ